MTRSRKRLLAGLAACAVTLGILAGLLAQTQTSAPHESSEDARRVAYEVAYDVALATDDNVVNDETPTVLSCREALENPTDGACRQYEAVLEDLLEDAQESCVSVGYLRAEDLSCVPESFYGHGLPVALFKHPYVKGVR